MSTLPEIRINFADLLYMGESKSLAEGKKLESYEQYDDWTAAYRKEWEKHEKKIMPALQDILDVQFYKSVIDVSCAPYFIPKSAPLIMNFRNEPDQFVDVLTHELCHVLLTDNDVVQIHNHRQKQPINLVEAWQKLFGKELDFNTLVHIPVHALCKYVYFDVMKEPSRLERDMESVKSYVGTQSYVDAWEYVEKHGYQKIIDDLKHMYAEAAA